MSTINFDLHPAQSRVFQIPARELLYGGAAGAGKSHLLRVYAIYCALEVPNCQIYIFRKSYKQLVLNHFQGPTGFNSMLQPLVKEGRVRINKSDMQILWDNGSIINLCHMQHEENMYDYQGAEFHVLLMDEGTHITETGYRFLRSRVRQPEGFVPDHMKPFVPRIIVGTNPGGISHWYYKNNFVDAAPPFKVWQADDDDGGFSRAFCPAKLVDNPSLDYKDYSKRLQGSSNDPDMVNALLDGNWDILSGAFFGNVWDRDVHVLEPFKLPECTTVVRGYDYGSAAPYSVLWIATLHESFATDTHFFAKGSKIVINEIYGGVSGKNNKGLEEPSEVQAKKILDFEKDPEFQYILNKNPVLAGNADNQIFMNFNGTRIYDAFRDAGVYFKPSDKSGGSIAVGLAKISSMLAVATNPERVREEPALYIFNTCGNLINIISSIERDERKPEVVSNKAGVNDHALDVLRYNINTKDANLNIASFSF